MIHIIRTLPELVRLTEIYKNPYILYRYKGNDWTTYTNFDNYNVKHLKLSKNLYLISCLFGQYYKIRTNDCIKLLDGSVVIDGYKRIDQDDIYSHRLNSIIMSSMSSSMNRTNIYKNNTENNIHNIYNGLDELYMSDNKIQFCKASSVYNTFLHYKTDEREL